MPNTIRIKRRAAGGASGAPSSLQNAELAFNEQDDILYYGKGTGGAGGTASQVIAIGGPGAYTPAAHVGSGGTAHAVATQSTAGFLSAADKTKLDGVEAGAQVNTVTSVAGKTGAVTLAVADVSGAAPLASPALTGTPTAPTAAAATNTTQIATTAFVQAAVSALIDAAPGALDTLNELAAAIGDDPNFAATLTNGLALKMDKSANLSDVADPGTARTNLGLGSMATQAASNVAITGGSVTNLSTFDGVTIDCGTF